MAIARWLQRAMRSALNYLGMEKRFITCTPAIAKTATKSGAPTWLAVTPARCFQAMPPTTSLSPPTANSLPSRFSMKKGAPPFGSRPPITALHRAKSTPHLPRTSRLFFPMAIFSPAPMKGAANFLYRMHPDGSNRQKIFPDRLLEIYSTSPDGRWILVAISNPSEEHPASEAALPVDGGSPVPMCNLICSMSWDPKMNYFYMSGEGQGLPVTYAIPLRSSHGLPEISGPITSLDELKTIKGVKVIPQHTFTATSPDAYVYTRQNIHRNLYRIPIP